MKSSFHTVDQLRDGAQRRLPRFAFDFMDGGSGNEQALHRNRDAFSQVQLVPRTLVNCETRDRNLDILGQSFREPFGIAPIGLANLIWPGTDVALARAAAAAEIPYILSTAGTTSIEDIAAVSSRAWFQLYVGNDKAIVDGLISRADVAGIPVLVVTVDVPAPGKRVRDLSNRFSLPFRPTGRMALDLLRHPAWALAMARAGAPRFANLEPYSQGGASARSLASLMAEQTSSRLDWDVLREIRSRWPRKLVVKGILDPRDAVHAKELGVDGIIVSNHGGRQLESSPAPIAALPDIRVAVGNELTIAVDGGARSGEDIATALALGADFVLLGRAFLYGIAAMGPDRGVAETIRMLSGELDTAQVQLGCRTYQELRHAHACTGQHSARPATLWLQDESGTEGR